MVWILNEIKKLKKVFTNYLTSVNEFEQVWIKFDDTSAIFFSSDTRRLTWQATIRLLTCEECFKLRL